MRQWLIAATAGFFFATPALADNNGARCGIPYQTVQSLQAKLATVVANPDANGGLFSPNRMWSAIVDRQGVLCSVIRSDPDAWPGSRDIAIAKASTANDFSNNKLALSTANLYSFAQPANTNGQPPIVHFPAGSLYGLNNSNPFNPFFNAQGTGIGQVPGGIITFGGGVALYQNGQVIGGLGVSGDTASPTTPSLSGCANSPASTARQAARLGQHRISGHRRVAPRHAPRALLHRPRHHSLTAERPGLPLRAPLSGDSGRQLSVIANVEEGPDRQCGRGQREAMIGQ